MSKPPDNNFVAINDLPENEQKALRAAIDGNPILTLPAEFDHFDPLTTDVAIYELRNVARRARALLENTNRDQIRRAVEFAEYATSQALIDLKKLDRPLSDDEAAACSGSLDELRPTALFRRQAFLDRSNFKPPAEMPWFAVFASLALAYVARSVNAGVNHGIEATDALSKAEHLVAKHKAGKASKRTDNRFKEILAQIISNQPGLSGNEYARRLIRSHSNEMINLHGKVYGVRVVADWARSILKAQK